MQTGGEEKQRQKAKDEEQFTQTPLKERIKPLIAAS